MDFGTCWGQGRIYYGAQTAFFILAHIALCTFRRTWGVCHFADMGVYVFWFTILFFVVNSRPQLPIGKVMDFWRFSVKFLQICNLITNRMDSDAREWTTFTPSRIYPQIKTNSLQLPLPGLRIRNIILRKISDDYTPPQHTQTITPTLPGNYVYREGGGGERTNNLISPPWLKIYYFI